MSAIVTPIEPPIEDQITERVRAYLIKKQGQWNLEKNLMELLGLEGGFVGRFDFFMPFIPQEMREAILVSGCSAGSELIVAERYGFSRIAGTEVIEDLVNISKARVSHDSRYRVDLYGGAQLPYRDEEFSVVYSGHIIEHTPSPYAYFKEHFRVLKPGGFFFLEFPNRYHSVELHTGLPSCEWMPWGIRDLALLLLASPLSPYPKEKRALFSLVRRTLRPVSLWQIKSYMKRAGSAQSKVVAVQIPAPGFIRVLVQK